MHACEHPEQKGSVCLERVAAAQCVCVHGERVCSRAASPEATGDVKALKVWTGCVVCLAEFRTLRRERLHTGSFSWFSNITDGPNRWSSSLWVTVKCDAFTDLCFVW